MGVDWLGEDDAPKPNSSFCVSEMGVGWLLGDFVSYRAVPADLRQLNDTLSSCRTASAAQLKMEIALSL